MENALATVDEPQQDCLPTVHSSRPQKEEKDDQQRRDPLPVGQYIMVANTHTVAEIGIGAALNADDDRQGQVHNRESANDQASEEDQAANAPDTGEFFVPLAARVIGRGERRQ
jgi:hypothetical protein